MNLMGVQNYVNLWISL